MPETVFDAVAEVASRRPDHPALVGADRTLAFGELVTEMSTLASRLAGEGAVGVLLPHDVDLVVAVLAAFGTDRPLVVLDPTADDALLGAVIEDAGVTTLVVGPSTAETGARLGPSTVDVAEPTGAEAVERSAADPRAPSLYAYTSGTTAGPPRAAVLSQRDLLRGARRAIDGLAITEDDRLPMLFPLSLAVAAYPALLPLLTGGTLCVRDIRTEGFTGFADWLGEQAITVMYLSPTVVRFLGDVIDALDLPSLRTVVLGGERVDAEAVQIARRLFGDHPTLVNGYGTTETGVLAFHRVDELPETGASVPIGRAVEGITMSVRGDDGEPVADGEPGELCVHGDEVFAGYLGRPDLDARVLLVGPEGGTTTYRTGDLAVRRPGGVFELVGRNDAQVKVAGHRVVPGAVEQAVLGLSMVKDAVVEAVPSEAKGHVLVAWVVPAGPLDEFSASELRVELGQVLATNQHPEHVVPLDVLPMLPNGKLDRRSLPAPDSWRPLSFSTMVAPRDQLERDLVAIWEGVLRLSPVGIQDDFADLGGSSLDAALMLVLVEERLDRVVPLSDLYQVRTVEQLAQRLRATAPTRRSTIVEVQAGSPDRPILWFAHDLHGSAFGLRHLAPHLDPDQPLWGFESPILRGPKSPFGSLELLALRYVADLREVQSEGPYHLAGYSFGGVLAFEMARQLVRDGHDVAFLGVVDVGPGYRGRHYHPKRPPERPWLSVPQPPPPGAGLAERARRWQRLTRERSWLVNSALMQTGLDWWADPVIWRLDLTRHGRIQPGRRLWYAWRQHWGLGRRYSWDGVTYPGPLTLFWADESAATDGTMGWGDVVEGELEIVHVDIPHEVMLGAEGVERLAAPLQAALDRAGASP